MIFHTPDLTIAHAALPADHEHRVVALVEEKRILRQSDGKEIPDPLNAQGATEKMLLLRELKRVTATEVIPPGEFKIVMDGITYKSVASTFYDPVTFFIRYGATEAWKIVNLTTDTHPFHVHLVQFQALGRQHFSANVAEGTGATNAPGAMDYVFNLHSPTPDESLLDANEKGWKDTIRVNPNELLTIAMRFDGHTGKYVYHCHLLEHEDHEMMRPFVVLPGAIIDKMHAGGGHGH